MGFIKRSSLILFLLATLVSCASRPMNKQEQVQEFFDGCGLAHIYLFEGQITNDVIIDNCLYLFDLNEKRKSSIPPKQKSQPVRESSRIDI